MKDGDLLVGASLEQEPGEVLALADLVVRGQIVARRVVAQPDGDIRYWGVTASGYPVLDRLQAFGERHFRRITGKLPGTSVMMVNLIEAHRAPKGSGGGWHRDSFRPQYKAIAYLTDVERASQGAFCYLPTSNGRLFRLLSALYRWGSGGNRYSDAIIGGLLKMGVRRKEALFRAGIPFLIDTSLIHRGLPISEGNRITAFVYMYERDLPREFQTLLETGIYGKAAG